ncbi:ABC transporter permease [Zavarzinia compransoris]|nr:ABC transporter permease [Zavarzinia compransoris]TDP43680.1 peptide/nickel transport system permease protein [Zavarzinia compransoris]
MRKGLAAIELAAGLGIALLFLALLVAGPWIEPFDPAVGQLRDRFKPIGAGAHWLGTDHLGRDLLSRVLAGVGWSVTCAVAATAISAVIGIALGLIAAEREGAARAVVLQAVNTVVAFPGLVIAICVIAVIGQGFLPLVLTLGLLNWPVFARVTYAEGRSLMARPYVLAARLSGTSRLAVLLGHVLPALGPTLAVVLAFHLADMLIAEAALSFLGIGAPVNQPAWGTMLAESRQYLFKAPQMLVVPAGAIVAIVVAANLIGDGIARRHGIKARAR